MFSAEEGVKVRAGSDWVWDAQFVTWQEPDSAAWPWTQPQHKHKHNFTITHTEKYGNIDFNIRSTGFAALGRALPKQTCAYSQKSVVPNCPSCLQVFTYQQLSTYSQERNVVNQRLSCLRLFSSCYKALICCWMRYKLLFGWGINCCCEFVHKMVSSSTIA